jgi:hypothetical protein
VSEKSTTAGVPTNTIAPATKASSGGRGVPAGSWGLMVSQSGLRSAVVT